MDYPYRRQRAEGPDFEQRYTAADARRLAPTRAEAAFGAILDELGGGVLRGEYKREWPVGEWCVDFYFPAIKLAVEIDGGYHRAQSRWRLDQRKTADLEAYGITVLRMANAEVFGGRERLVERLRAAWRQAAIRQRDLQRAEASSGVALASEPALHTAKEPARPYAPVGPRASLLFVPYLHQRSDGIGLRKSLAPALRASILPLVHNCVCPRWPQAGAQATVFPLAPRSMQWQHADLPGARGPAAPPTGCRPASP